MQTVPAKSIVIRNQDTGWFGCEYNMNLYRGCCHGCIYCDSRSDCYRIEQFDTVCAKADALRIVRDELRRKVRTGVVATGSMSDPYNPFEREEKLTRHALELLDAYGFGAAVATKSDLITRDTDILTGIAERSPVIVKFTVTTLDEALAAKLEPNAPPPSRRLEALRHLAGQGLFTGLLLMPVLPFLEDSEENILSILRAAADAGARFVYAYFGVTLRENQRDYFYNRLDESFPGLREQYVSRFGGRYDCRSPRAGKLEQLYREECDRLGLLRRMQDIVSAYRQGYGDLQLRFEI